MQEVTHSELINKARNCESMMVLYTVDGEGNEEGFCVNPTDEMRDQMAFEAGELTDESEETDPPAAEGDAAPGAEGGEPTSGVGQAPATPEPTDTGGGNDAQETDSSEAPEPDKA